MKSLALFWTCGYPTEAATLRVIRLAQEAGVDLLEIGIPFSDPIADGPVIQASSHAALQSGMTVRRALSLVRRARREGCTLPMYLMTYVNPLLAYGMVAVCNDAVRSGVAGFVIPDLPLEAQARMLALPHPRLNVVQLIAPTTPPKRMAVLAKASRGFVYAVSLTGVTGVRRRIDSGIAPFLRQVKRDATVPVLAGFGIAIPDHARRLAPWCDGVIVGSAALKIAASSPRGGWERPLARWLRAMRRSLDG